jgi:hypothetical protein
MRRSQRTAGDLAVLEGINRLVDDYRGYVPAATVIRCAVRCRDELLRAGVRAGLAAAVEAMARLRLDDGWRPGGRVQPAFAAT